MMTTTDGVTIDNNNNDVVMIFRSSLVQNVASPKIRLPSNFVGVRCVRRERECNSSSKNTNTQSTSDDPLPSANNSNNNNDDDADDVDGGGDDENVARNNKYVKFVVVDENGNERRMTKAEKKKKKRQLAKENKEQAQQNSAKKQKLEEGISSTIPSSTATAMAMATEGQEGKSSSSPPSSSSYHQLPINPTTMDQELADFKCERAGLPTVLLSPPMALQFFSKNLHALPEIIPLVVDKEELLLNDDEEIVEDAHNNNNNCYDTNGDDSAVLIHSHTMAEDWSNRLKEKCILPAESVRQTEDLRPLAYRLHPEPWQRMRPTPIKEQPMLTTSRSRNRYHNPEKEDKKKSLIPKTTDDQIIVNPNPRDWITLTCRPRLTSSSSSSSSSSILQHDDILSIVFEYIHRETPFYLSCGAKFGSDYLIYDGPRESRHAFAGLRVLSRFTNSMTSSSSSLLPTTDQDLNALSSPSPSSELQLPLPTAFSLTSFVRCLNTAGKLALLATVEEVQVVVPDSNEEQQQGSNGENDIDQNDTITRKINNNNITTHYRVAFVDVALEKVLDVHKRKKGSSKKKLQKRRDVTQNLAKK